MANIFDWKKSVPVSFSRGYTHPFIPFKSEFNKALSEFYNSFDLPQVSQKLFENLSINPLVDIVEEKNNFKIEMEMPGLDEKDIQVSIKDGILFVKGEKTTSKKDKDVNYLSREINYGSYERSVLLPESADFEKASASFKKGMLWITIPKKTGAKITEHSIKIEKASE